MTKDNEPKLMRFEKNQSMKEKTLLLFVLKHHHNLVSILNIRFSLHFP